MAQYKFTYNNYTFPFAKLQTTMAVEYAEDRATQIGTAYDITITGVITAATESGMANLVVALRGALQVPRQNLVIQWSPDGSTWNTFYNFTAATDTSQDTTDVDIRWGPLPDALELHQFTGGKAALYTWRCRVATKDCIGGSGSSCTLNGRVQDVIAATTSWQFTVDNNGLTTATISGVLVISSNAQALGFTPDNYRYYVTPDCPVNFQRQSADYRTAPDGLTMTYSIVDREVPHTFPAPITGGQVNWRVSIRGMGGMVDYSLSGWYSAPPQIPKSTLIQRIGEMMSVKFPLGSASALIWTELELDEDVYENKLSFRVNAYAPIGTNAGTTAFNFNAVLNTIDTQITDSNGTAYIPGPYGGDAINGNSGVIALPVAIWNPCISHSKQPIQQGGINPGGKAPSGSSGDGNPYNPYDYPPGTITQDHQVAPYTAYHEVIEYFIDNHIAVYAPKKKGAKPFIQQTAVPTMTVIQAGYAIRDSLQDTASDNQPVPADPVLELTGSDPSGVMIQPYVSPVNLEPIGNQGYVRMQIRWRYVMKVTQTIEDNFDNVQFKYPDDPRLSLLSPDIKLPDSVSLVVKPE